MGSSVQASPEELERFASELRQFNQQLKDSTRRLQGSFHRLGETWRDQEHQKFATEFDQTMRVLQKFMESSEQQIPYLQRKARTLRDFLNQR